MIRTGEVIEISGSRASVVFDRPDACASCNGCPGRQCAHVEIDVDTATTGNIETGDLIDVEMPDQSVLKASAVAYLLPVIMLVAGLLAGNALYAPLGVSISKDLFTALAALVSLTAGLLLVGSIDRKMRGMEQWKPAVLSVRKKEEQGSV